MRTLKELDAIAAKLQDLSAQGLSPARHRRETDRLTWSIYEILQSSIRKQVARKGMKDHVDDVQQHSLIAINSAVATWEPERSSFSTFVHWKLMAELRTLELHLFPARRALAKNLDIKHFSMDEPIFRGDPDGCAYAEINNLNPEAEQRVHDNAEKSLLYRRMDEIFARMMSGRVGQFEIGGYVYPRGVLTGMRDIHIFILRELHETCANDVAAMYDLTRERIRQITASVDKLFKQIGASGKPLDLSENCARQWKLAVALYKEHADIDVRLGDSSALLSSSEYERPRVIEALPAVDFTDALIEVDQTVTAEIAEDHAFAGATQQELDLAAEEQPEQPIKRATFVQKARAAILAAQRPARGMPDLQAILPMFEQPASAANDEAMQVEDSAMPASGKRKILPFIRKSKAAAFAMAAIASIASSGVAAKAPPNPSIADPPATYAVKLDVKGDKGEIRLAAPAERAKHAEFSDLQIAYVPGAIERENSLAFAPLAWLDAQRICSDMTAKGEKCSIIRFGRDQG